MSKFYCMSCQKDVSNEDGICECGGRSIIGGELIISDKQFLCKCNHDKFKTGMHMDAKDKAITNYSCENCGNVLTTTYYRDKDDLMYWDDE